MKPVTTNCTFLGALTSIPDGGAKEIREGLLILRRGDDAWAYRNVCPHFSVPLNYEPDTFCTYESRVLMCAHHSAMFRFEDGLCVDGPCSGARLTPVAITIHDNNIFIDEGGDSDDENKKNGA
ncbi:Rieske (2Fe-2S) protein [Caballeronia grimmiae]|jgi:nitrite reductase/ring-hydroxylating ferredoxin subunit|uniref:Rieske (2Fe-2S) protein n=1 Tax=Caballeronia grimmiae TaxID=1071679 RepID=UPI0038BCB775